MIGHIHDIDLRDAERSFEEFFSSCGFSLPSGGLKLDGHIHRFRVGEKNDLSGSYQFWPDGLSHDVFSYARLKRVCGTIWMTWPRTTSIFARRA